MRHITTTSTDPAILVGLDTPDDAAVYRIDDSTALVQTVDFFTPIVDDARSWGRIAAANALSDVYAMGGKPITALNLVGWPRSLGFDLLGRVLEGGEEVCTQAGVAVVGGHSVDDPEPKFGLAVTGLVTPDKLVRKTGASAGCEMVLTKALGTGVISSAIKDGVAEPDSVDAAVRSMTALNKDAAEVMVEFGVSAATDVTGFGLMGHLLQMLDDRLDAELVAGAIPLLPGARDLAARGILPGGSKRNLEHARNRVDSTGLDSATVALLFDAQTSGGLLMATPPGSGDELVRALVERGEEHAALIGVLKEGSGYVTVRHDA